MCIDQSFPLVDLIDFDSLIIKYITSCSYLFRWLGAFWEVDC